MIKKDICSYCYHAEDEHKAYKDHTICSGKWTDQGLDVPCYCHYYIKQTPETIKKEIEDNKRRYILFLQSQKLSNKIKKFFKKFFI